MGSWNLTNNTFIPNRATAINQVVTNAYQRTNATYALIYAFEPDWGWLQQRQNKLDAYLQQGWRTLAASGERDAQRDGVGLDAADRRGRSSCWRRSWGSCRSIYHRLGRMAQEAGQGLLRGRLHAD